MSDILRLQKINKGWLIYNIHLRAQMIVMYSQNIHKNLILRIYLRIYVKQKNEKQIVMSFMVKRYIFMTIAEL